MIDKILSIPLIFQLQQRLCNSYENVREHYNSVLKAGPLKILEIGCSTGAAGQVIFNMKRDSYTGIDITPKYIEYAAKHYQLGQYRVMDARALDFQDNSFDLVVFIGVLHHMDDETIKKCMKEVKRVLKQTGRLIISEPVFTANKLISNILLSLDRGKYIRESEEYGQLLDGFKISRREYFKFSAHRFFGLEAMPEKHHIEDVQAVEMTEEAEIC